MRIVFNFQGVGLGNNGGSRTIVKCAEALSDLGQEVILSSPVSRYTWHPLKVKVSKRVPDCDVIIATGYGSVKSTLKSKAKAKFYYVRGLEVWQTNKNNLLKSFRSLKCIVNSEWLKGFMSRHSVPCDLVYPGLDFGDFQSLPGDREYIGGLFHAKHRTKRHEDLIKLSERLDCPLLLLNRDLKNADPSELHSFYNKIKVWISPSELEGLHNCPMEASLCGCGLVATDHPKGGTSDYAIHDKTSLVYPAGDLDVATARVRQLLLDDKFRLYLNNNMIEHLREKIGDRKSNMKKMLCLFQESV